MDEDLELIRQSGGERQLKRAAWERVLSVWRQSGLGPSEFCRHHGLSRKRMDQWRKRLAAPLAPPAGSVVSPLVEVTCTPDCPVGVTTGVLEIQWASAIVPLPYERGAAQLTMILRSLQEAAC